MTNENALTILEAMSNSEFDDFFVQLPERTKLLTKSSFVDWRQVLPAWYIKLIGDKNGS